MESQQPAVIWYYSRFFGVKKGVIDQDLGDSLVVRVNGNPQIVKRGEIDSKRTDDGGWWSSMDVFADKCLQEEEAWFASIQAQLDDIETEIAALRKEREREVSEAREKLERTRKWLAEFKFDEAAL